MGNRISTKTETTYLMTREQPSPDTAATLYYFGGRGLADQIRWMLAANEITFCQKVVDTREKFVKMAERQLVFGQLPLLQIDGIEIVQSQAIVRYLANRSNMAGYSLVDKNRCDMIAETVRDMINLVAGAPFQRVKSAEAAEAYRKVLKDKWNAMAPRFEGILKLNGGKFLVGTSLTYADVLVAHMMTWYVEEVMNRFFLFK